jgi:hypothetical protein
VSKRWDDALNRKCAWHQNSEAPDLSGASLLVPCAKRVPPFAKD